MTDALRLAGALVAGALAGTIYFAGLWVTVRALPVSRHPALVTFASLVFRLALAFVCFFTLVRTGGWTSIVAGLAGFLLARTVIVSRLRPLTHRSERPVP